MSIMDTLQSAIGSGTAPQSNGTLEAISHLLSQNGGVQSLIQNFQQKGLGSVVQSWIGTGHNLPIQPDQIRSVIGEDRFAQISQKVGMQPEDLMQKMSQYLPKAIDMLTPHGQVQADQFSLPNLLTMGKNLFH